MTKKFELTKVDKKAIKNVVESLRPTPVFLHTVSDKQFKSIGDVNEVISQLADEAYRKDVVEFCTNISLFFVEKYGEDRKEEILEEISTVAEKAMNSD